MHMWLAAAVFVHLLAQLNTTLPIVVFNVTELPQPAVTLIESLGARVTSLEPSITVPEEFHSHLLQWPFSTKRGATVMRRFAPYAKLGVWGQTQWSKVVLVDVDVVFAANVDEMGAMPAGMPAGIPSHLRRAIAGPRSLHQRQQRCHRGLQRRRHGDRTVRRELRLDE